MTSDSPAPAVSPDSAAERAQQAWHRARTEYVSGPQGALSLVFTHWGTAGEAPVAEDIARAEWPAAAKFTRLERSNIDTGETEHGYRIWDTQSPAHRAFRGIDSYGYNPDWVIQAEFEYVDEARSMPFEHLRDAGATRALPVSGDIVFTLDGEEHRLAAFDAGDKLQLVFADATSRSETYPSGRFLFLPRPEGATPGARVPLVVDFNRAFVPPCGFSNQMNCPLPPASNRFTQAITAGEKKVVWADGFSL
ncbi:DUF1684 domain-containing protein [Mycetocola spongiae]|uniref:DUF1684 domain-containing protein n=1 Tax=Mycetocola spongiae TaxID=2859226 RepID=UPI001CF56806|nr:DUF1684 domain-containing protein [Mycetocola spongiae]UCR89146.1 DUF1684 domain-containing protein [Mycetocola spongiae]